MKAQTGMKIIMAAVVVMLATLIFIYGYKYTVGLKDKLKSEGLIGKQEVSGNWSEFQMPYPGAEIVECFVGMKDGEKVMKNYPVKLCPVDIDDLKEDRIIYEAFLVANSGNYGAGEYKVKNVYLGNCPQCYTVSLKDGEKTVLVRLNGLVEEEVKVMS
ncbi:TPA: hypothetical protein HA265_08260 [Candidatus Woesearchaeota archaeon]|nr:hypothetical protein [Candidatus Woesearchaeota archaeon]